MMKKKRGMVMYRCVKLKRGIAKILVFIFMVGIISGMGIAQAEDRDETVTEGKTAISGEAAEPKAIQAVPESIEVVSANMIEIDAGPDLPDTEKTGDKENTADVLNIEDTENTEDTENIENTERTEGEENIGNTENIEDAENIKDTEKADGRKRVSKRNVTPGGSEYEKKLYKDNAWNGGQPDAKTELADNAVVSFNDQLIMQYKFELTPDNIEKILRTFDKTYPLTCPEGLKWVAGESIDITYTNEDTQKEIKFATLKQERGADGTITASFTFLEEGLGTAPDGIENIYVYLGCQLDRGKLGEPPEPEKYEIILSTNNTLTISIAENQPKASALTEKKGSYQNGTFTWTIIYEPGKKEENLPLTLVDEFNSTYHDYKEGSFQVTKKDGSAININSGDVTVEKNGSMTKLTYKIPEEVSKGTDPVTITYHTMLTDQGLTSTKNQTVTNTACLMNSQNQKIGSDVKGNAAFQKVDWLQKTSGTLQEENGQRYIPWTVTVKTNGKKLDKLVLHDRLESGTEYAEIDLNSIVIKADRNGVKTDETNGNGHVIAGNTDNDSFDLTFHTTNTTNLADEYIVTYHTVIKEDYFHGDKQEVIKNQAVLDYGWLPGDGSGNMFTPESPKVERPANVDGRMITKAGAGYNPGTHKITWRVVVNPHRLDLAEILITDAIKEYGQTYVPNSFSVEGSTVTGTDKVTVTEPPSDDPTGTLTIKFTGTGTQSFAYTFKTTVDAPEDYAYNLRKKTYQNKVTATAKLKQSSGDPAELTASAAGTQDIQSNVLQKKAEGYHYDDHTIGWCITVNENKMPMKSSDGILLEDTLAEGLTYVLDSLEVTKEVTDSGGSVKTESDSRITLQVSTEGERQKLTFLCGKDTELKDKLYIRFRTKADVDTMAAFKNQTEFNISNTALLKRDGYGELEESASQEMANQILAKSGKYNKEQGTIFYTVNLNPHGITLEDTTVRDDLPEGLQLDQDTIKLYQAAVDKEGVFTKGNPVDLTGSLTVNVLERWFEIKLEKANVPYILEYTTDVTDITKTSFNNKISLKGTVSGGAEQGGTDVGLGSGGGGGGGTSSPKVNLTLQKTDALRPGVQLEGAVFQISDESGPLNQVTTDADGKAVFRYLKRGKKYTLREITPPVGYQRMENAIEISIDNDKDVTPKEYMYPAIVNNPVTGTLSFDVRSNDGDFLAGAEFMLADQTEGSDWTAAAVSSADGKVIFKDIPYGTYKMTETKTPEDYVPNGTEYRVVTDENGRVTLTNPSDTGNPDRPLTEIVNVVKGVPLTIKKIDRDTKEALANVEFAVSAEKTAWEETKSTDENGIVKFENLGVGREYLIRENVPEGYGTDAETRKVILTEDGLVLIWENYRAADVRITMQNSMNQRPVAGVRMGLWRRNTGSTWEDVKDSEPYKTMQSDGNGILSFDGLAEGDYWLYMLNSPEEYEPEARLLVLKVAFNDQGEPILTITNGENGEEIDGIIGVKVKEPQKPAEPSQPDIGEPERPTRPNPGEPEQPPQPNPGEPEQPARPDIGEPEQPGRPNSGEPERLSQPSPGEPVQSEKLESRGRAETETAGSEDNTSTATQSPTPQTGDDTLWVWYLAAMLLSGGVIVLTVLYRVFKKNYEKTAAHRKKF